VLFLKAWDDVLVCYLLYFIVIETLGVGAIIDAVVRVVVGIYMYIN